MNEQILFSGVTPVQLTDIIVNGIKEELGKIFNSKKEEQKLNEDENYTIKKACDFLKCSETKLWRLRRSGKLKEYRSGRRILLKKSELEGYLLSSNQ
jgi:excisionase family DNA binding protein